MEELPKQEPKKTPTDYERQEMSHRENLEAWTDILADISRKANEIEQLKQGFKYNPEIWHGDEQRSGLIGARIVKARDELSAAVDTLKKILAEQEK